jgi:hypothetical protein
MGIGDMYKKIEKNISFVTEPNRREIPPLQKDLFTENNTVKSEPPPAYAPEKEKVIEKVLEASVNKSVEKIILFYSDKTFVEFRPSS